MDTISTFLHDNDDVDQQRGDWRAVRRLGRAVIAMAAADAVSAAGMRDIHISTRNEARAFLRGGESLSFWCQVAGLPVALVQRVARQRWPVADAREAA